MPSVNDKDLRAFVDGIPDAKLQNFGSGEYSIVTNRDLGFRLDHQGINQDGSGTDRLFIQPLGQASRGKSQASKMHPSKVLAQVHVKDPADPKKVREGLWNSIKSRAALVKVS